MNFSNSNSECTLAECHVLPKFLCSGCTTVYYCSKDHQVADWKNHKNVCSPLLQTSMELGRHYVASRDLKAGTLIVSELPLLVEPQVQSMDPQLNILKSVMQHNLKPSICLACCGPADGKKCPKCDWPICSIKCSEAKIHAENECSIFVKNSLKMDEDDYEITYNDLVFIIRAMLLKKSQPQLWAKIQDLQSENSNKTPAGQFKGRAIGYCTMGFLSIFRLKFQKLEKDFGEDFFETSELVKLNGIQMMNAFPYFYSSDKNNGDKLIFIVAKNLYLKSSMFSFACFPNCFWRISNGPEFKIEIRTAVDISKGQVFSISYTMGDFVLGSLKHNLRGQKLGHFSCFCARCVDPTELNSMMSAVKCKKEDCQYGYLIPKDPKNLSPSSIWACVKCGGQSTETWENIENLVKRAKKMIKKFQLFEPKKIEDLLTILRKHLHPNHWVIQRFCQTVMKKLEEKFDSDYDKAEDTLLEYYIGIAKYLLQVFHVTMPGLNYYKSDFQCKLYIALDSKLARMEKFDKNTELVKEMRELFDEFLKIKKYDPRYLMNDGQWKPNMLGLIAMKEKLEIFLNENEN